VKQQKDNME